MYQNLKIDTKSEKYLLEYTVVHYQTGSMENAICDRKLYSILGGTNAIRTKQISILDKKKAKTFEIFSTKVVQTMSDSFGSVWVEGDILHLFMTTIFFSFFKHINSAQFKWPVVQFSSFQFVSVRCTVCSSVY